MNKCKFCNEYIEKGEETSNLLSGSKAHTVCLDNYLAAREKTLTRVSKLQSDYVKELLEKDTSTRPYDRLRAQEERELDKQYKLYKTRLLA